MSLPLHQPVLMNLPQTALNQQLQQPHAEHPATPLTVEKPATAAHVLGMVPRYISW